MKKISSIIVALLTCIIMFSCGETKYISKGNYLYKYVDNQATPGRPLDKFEVHKVDKCFKAEIEDKLIF